MVRKPSVESLMVIHLFSSAKKNFLVCRLGKNLRLVFMFECETVFPPIGTLPVT